MDPSIVLRTMLASDITLSTTTSSVCVSKALYSRILRYSTVHEWVFMSRAQRAPRTYTGSSPWAILRCLPLRAPRLHSRQTALSGALERPWLCILQHDEMKIRWSPWNWPLWLANWVRSQLDCDRVGVCDHNYIVVCIFKPSGLWVKSASRYRVTNVRRARSEA